MTGITLIALITLFWVIIFIIAFIQPTFGTLIIENKKRYVMWYNGLEDGATIRKYVIIL